MADVIGGLLGHDTSESEDSEEFHLKLVFLLKISFFVFRFDNLRLILVVDWNGENKGVH